jgi:hypothetical protein
MYLELNRAENTAIGIKYEIELGQQDYNYSNIAVNSFCQLHAEDKRPFAQSSVA